MGKGRDARTALDAPATPTANGTLAAAPVRDVFTASSELPSSTATWEHDWGLFLRLARQVAGLSLTDLAARSGLSKGYLSKLESGTAGARNPSRSTLAALAYALPSFRALAHMLDPGLTPTPLMPPPQAPGADAPDQGAAHAIEQGPPLRVGWRELEIVLVVITFDRGALPTPLTAPVIARALDRSVADVTPVLSWLVREGVLAAEASHRVGGPVTYTPGVDLARRLGISRVGDGLVLAAALLARAGSAPPRPAKAATDGEAREVADHAPARARRGRGTDAG